MLALGEMFMHGESLGKEVCIVVGARLPTDNEVCLADAVTNPVVAYVYGLGAFLLHGVVRDADGARVVGVQSVKRGVALCG